MKPADPTSLLNDSDTSIEFLRKRVETFVHERAWEQFHNPKDLASAIAIEAAELMERFLWKTESQLDKELIEPQAKQRIVEELADILLLCLSLANRLDIDVTQAMLEKIEHNAVKYPVHKAHGRSEKYTHYQENDLNGM